MARSGKYPKWKYPKFKVIPGVGRACFANAACHGTKPDGSPCNCKALAGGYYCKAHVPK